MLTGLDGIEWSFDVRQDHVLYFFLLPIFGHGWFFEGQGVCPPTHT